MRLESAITGDVLLRPYGCEPKARSKNKVCESPKRGLPGKRRSGVGVADGRTTTGTTINGGNQMMTLNNYVSLVVYNDTAAIVDAGPSRRLQKPETNPRARAMKELHDGPTSIVVFPKVSCTRCRSRGPDNPHQRPAARAAFRARVLAAPWHDHRCSACPEVRSAGCESPRPRPGNAPRRAARQKFLLVTERPPDHVA